MSHDNHNNNGHSEPKKVSFGTPMLLGAITVFIILCFVSLGNPCHHEEMCCEDGKKCSKECMEACEKGDHSKHPAEAGHEEGHAAATHEEHATETPATETAAADSTKAEPAKEEAHH
jgi:hypothetical protein